MKKFLLLPLLALMFVGCSKDALTEKTPELAAAQTAKNSAAIRVAIDIREFYTVGWGGPLFVSYVDENGEQKQLRLREGQDSNVIMVSSSTMEISGISYGGDKQRAGVTVRTNMIEGDPDGYRAEYKGLPNELPYSIIIPVYKPMASDEAYTVIIIAEAWDEFL